MNEVVTSDQRISDDAQQLMRSLIDTFVATGEIAPVTVLANVTGLSVSTIELMLVELRDSGRIGMERYAMCAIDALGTAPMLEREITIKSACPVCQEPLQIEATPNGVTSTTPARLVLTNRRVSGPAHLTRCGVIRFYCSADHAEAWIKEYGSQDGTVLTLDDVFERAAPMWSAQYAGGVTNSDCCDCCST